MILRAGFWPAPRFEPDLDGEALAAATGLMTLTAIPERYIPAIEYDAALPENAPDTVVVPVDDERLEVVRLSPAARLLVAAWKGVRPTNTVSTKLFVTGTGAEVSVDAFSRHMEGVVEALGLGESFDRCARRFFVDNFYRHPDHVPADAPVLERYLKRFDRRCPERAFSASERRLIVSRADPFPDAGKRFLSDERAIEEARRIGTGLPDTYEACFAPKVDKDSLRLPDDHPLHAELAAAELSRHNATRGKQLLDIYIRHRADLDRRADDGTLPRLNAAPVFGLKQAQYMRMVAKAKRLAGELPPKPGRRRPRVRPTMTAQEAERLRRIEETADPGEAEMPEFRRSLARRHGPFLFDLARQKKISNEQGARLLRVDLPDFGDMKLDHEAGVFDHWLRPRPKGEEHRSWVDLIREKLSEREEGQGDAAFIRMLRKKYGLPIARGAAIRAIRAPRREAVVRVPSTGAAAAQPTEMEKARLEKIASRPRPTGLLAVQERNARLKKDAPFVFDLVRADRLQLQEAGSVLDLTKARAGELYRLHLDGDLHLALKTNTRAESKRNRELLVAELERRGAEKGIAALCRDIRRRHRVYISLAAAQMILARFKEAHGRKPIGHHEGAYDVKPDAKLSPEERTRLKGIAATDWDGAPDIDALRRSLLTTDGRFLMGLVADRKISGGDGAALTRLDPYEFPQVRRDFARGHEARHCEAPPQGEERLRQEEAVVKLAVVSEEEERYYDFVVRLGPSITLPHWRIRALRKAAFEGRRDRKPEVGHSGAGPRPCATTRHDGPGPGVPVTAAPTKAIAAVPPIGNA